MPEQISLAIRQMKKKGGEKKQKTGTFKICMLQIPLNLSFVEALVLENPPRFGKRGLPTRFKFYYISLVGPRHVLLIWQYFLPGDIFMGAL